MMKTMPRKRAWAAAALAAAAVLVAVACDLASPGRSRQRAPTEVKPVASASAADSSGLLMRVVRPTARHDSGWAMTWLAEPPKAVAHGTARTRPESRIVSVNVDTIHAPPTATITRKDGTVEKRDVEVVSVGTRTSNMMTDAVLVVDGERRDVSVLRTLDPGRIARMDVLKGEAAAKYLGGQEGKAVILVTTK